MSIGIYKITSPTGKIYVGQSVNIENRFSCYKCTKAKGQPKLSKSLNKYGIDNHIFEILETCSIAELNPRERYYQEYYNTTTRNGLNCSLTKSNDKSGKVSEETRNKMRIAGKKKIFTEKHKKNLKIALNKRILSKTHIENLKISSSKTHSIKVINMLTNKIYKNIKEAALDNNINYGTLKQKLSGVNKTPHKYLKYYIDETI